MITVPADRLVRLGGQVLNLRYVVKVLFTDDDGRSADVTMEGGDVIEFDGEDAAELWDFFGEDFDRPR